MRYKTSGVIDSAAKMLVGNKRLTGRQLDYIDNYVTRHGAIKPELKNNRGFFKGILLGNEHVMDINKARYMQGGLLGKGGLIRGELAPSDEYMDSARNLKNYILSDAGTPSDFGWKDAKNLATGTPMNALNIGFNVGMPTVEAYKAAKGESEEYGDRKGAGAGAALGSGLGFLLTSQMGMPAGMVASYIGKRIGESAGGVFDRKKTPAEEYMQNMGISQRALM
jgi:hypothetical protein